MHPDQRFIIYLKENNAQGIDEIYALYSNNVKRYIVKNSGSLDDAADIFQEGLIDIYNLAHNPSFKLTCPFEAFLITICKRKWLNVLKKRGRKPVTISLEGVYTHIQDDLIASEAYADQIEEEDAVLQVLESMGDRCKSIIKACMGKDSQEIIAEKLGISYAYLRKKKSECMANLRKLVNDHPLFKIKKIKQQEIL